MPRKFDPNEVGYLYFIESPDQEAYKIGFASDPHQRLRTLQTGNPATLVLEACVRATFDAEAAFHDGMKDYQIAREWYRDCNEVDAVIEEIRDAVLGRALYWLSLNQPNATGAALIRMGYENTVLDAFDIQRALRSVFEGDDEDYMMSAQAARALMF